MDLVDYHLRDCPSQCKRIPTIPISYGTSGFRYESQFLAPIVYRVGILASLRSKDLGVAVGVMITASHNPEKDNGVKIIDGDGGMLCQEWEKYALDLCLTEYDEIESYIEKLSQDLKINILASASVYVGRDTRKSGEDLIEYLISGIDVLPYVYHYNYGKTTTPILHYNVYRSNTEKQITRENEYFDQMVLGYNSFKQCGVTIQNHSLIVDCANGVGALKLLELVNLVDDLKNVVIRNDGSSGELNHLCGAEHVKIYQKGPENFEFSPNDRCASFDGDADRIIYFFKTVENNTVILDGDYISVLFIHYISSLLTVLPGIKLRIGFVHTAYSNSSTVELCKAKGFDTVCTKTGVKHLHSAAKKFDIGVYFEANGHGTVLFGENYRKIISSLDVDVENQNKITCIQKLLALPQIINQTNGDAIANLFAVEIILSDLNWSFTQWRDLINPLPYFQLKVHTEKKDIIKTSDDESTILSPDNMQQEVNEVVTQYPESRAFLRPSGTENVVRIFAESKTNRDCEEICEKLKSIVMKYCA